MKPANSRLTVQGIVLSALFGALMMVFSYIKIHIGISPVPITLENMAVLLAGVLLGPLYGFFSTFTVVFLLALGLPVLSGTSVGLARLLGPTGGFLWMFPICALLVGWVTRRIRGTGWPAYVAMFAAIEIFGVLLAYAGGVPWLQHKLHVSFGKALLMGFVPYIGGDTIKALLVTFIAMQVRRAFGTIVK
ncbi:biotin transporter BioY [Paenibacillus flagellatus]|uniref:Biotin transporter n=1 Tax=Paenibacillus flagellatus TaxID=2211139 RepID=A0A2V5JV44_9BACL|nr:biotin transporter BioY [Paenibacillus flagellatus]PYI50539.1 biotin transporter BioY [Paenibacillus flagellatus]